MSCFLNISGWQILRTFLNPQAKSAVKKKKCLPCTSLSTSCTFPSTSCSTGSVETGSDHFPSPGHLGRGALNINTPLSRVLGKGHPSLPHTQRPGTTSERHSPADDLKVFTIITGVNRMEIKPESCAEILPSRSKKEHSASQHFLPKMISDSSVPIHSEQRP